VIGSAEGSGWVGCLYGVAITVLQTAVYLKHEPGEPAGGGEPLPIALFAAVALALYGTAFVAVTTERKVLLTFTVLVMLPLNFISLASVGFALVPATALLVVSSILPWIAA
jgi:hypothetical protein